MKRNDKSYFPVYYELFIWLFYCCFFKYAYYEDGAAKLIKPNNEYFPHASLIIYAVAISLFWIPFYRIVLPWILTKKRYWLMFVAALIFIAVFSIINNFIISFLFKSLYANTVSQTFYNSEFAVYSYRLQQFRGYSLEILFPDLIAFSSIGFMRFAFENEQKKRMLEQQNFQLQINTLKAQINPHFLFNTLNTIYGKSLANSNETPDSILRLSDMMRYILYESDADKVSLEKEITFIENFLVMEKQRFADMQLYFSVQNTDEYIEIAPLIFLPFAENCVKHGAQHIKDNAIIRCNISMHKNRLFFMMENETWNDIETNKSIGGVGLKNVKARLELYYPSKHKLDVTSEKNMYKVNLEIDLS